MKNRLAVQVLADELEQARRCVNLDVSFLSQRMYDKNDIIDLMEGVEVLKGVIIPCRELPKSVQTLRWFRSKQIKQRDLSIKYGHQVTEQLAERVIKQIDKALKQLENEI